MKDDKLDQLSELILLDSYIKHCRINTINGNKLAVNNFIDTLRWFCSRDDIVETNTVTMRHYNTYEDLDNDLFARDWLDPTWFNIFVFTIDPTHVKEQIVEIQRTVGWLRTNLDSQMYASTIVSPISIEDMCSQYGEGCPVNFISLRYYPLNCDSEEVLDFIYNTLHCHSTNLLSDFYTAVKNLNEVNQQILAKG